MSKLSVGFEYSDGAIRVIHGDHKGHPLYSGEQLLRFYVDPIEVLQLIKNGDFASLAPLEYMAFYKMSDVSWDWGPEEFHSREESLKHVHDYYYLYSNGSWFFYPDEENFTPLPEVMRDLYNQILSED